MEQKYIVFITGIGTLKDTFTSEMLDKLLRLFGATLESYETTTESFYIITSDGCIGIVHTEQE